MLCSPEEAHFNNKDTSELKNKSMEKIGDAKINQKNTGVTTFIRQRG